jgi:hypothetical protein
MVDIACKWQARSYITRALAYSALETQAKIGEGGIMKDFNRYSLHMSSPFITPLPKRQGGLNTIPIDQLSKFQKLQQ